MLGHSLHHVHTDKTVHQRLLTSGFCGQWSALTPGSNDSALVTGVYWLHLWSSGMETLIVALFQPRCHCITRAEVKAAGLVKLFHQSQFRQCLQLRSVGADFEKETGVEYVCFKVTTVTSSGTCQLPDMCCTEMRKKRDVSLHSHFCSKLWKERQLFQNAVD